MFERKLKIVDLIIALSFFSAIFGGVQGLDQPSNATEVYAAGNASVAASDGQNAESTYSVMNVTTDQAETLTCTSSEGNLTETNETAASNLTDVNPEADINVGDLPVCTITAPSKVCANSKGNKAAVPLQPGATYFWTVTHGVITAGQYTKQITWDALSDTPVTLSVTVKKKYGSDICTCSNSVSVQVNANPDCTITAPSSVCARSKGNVAEVPSKAGASYSWEITNGIIKSGQGENKIIWDASDVAPITITVTVIKTYGSTACTCKRSVQIQVHSSPDCTIAALSGVCAGSTGNTAAVPYQSGATYAWTVANGNIASGQGTNLITWDAEDATPATIAVTVSKTIDGTVCICSSSVDVQVYPSPDCTITVPRGVCAGSRDNIASVPPNEGASFAWIVKNGAIMSGQGTNQIKWQAFSTSPVTISVTVSKYYSSKLCSCSNSIQVEVFPNPICTITAPRNVCVGSEGNKASVPYQDPAEYKWKITNGVITAGEHTNEITWDALQTTPVTIEVAVTKDYGSTKCSCSG
jgi:hypothetical protein